MGGGIIRSLLHGHLVIIILNFCKTVDLVTIVFVSRGRNEITIHI